MATNSEAEAYKTFLQSLSLEEFCNYHLCTVREAAIVPAGWRDMFFARMDACDEEWMRRKAVLRPDKGE